MLIKPVYGSGAGSTDDFGRILMRPGMNFAEMQNLVDTAGEHKTFYFYPNTVYDFGGSLLKTASIGQSFISEGRGAELGDGGIEIFNRRCAIANLRLTGVTTNGFGIHITDDTYWQAYGGGGLPPATFGHEYSTFLRVRDVEIWDKTWAVYNDKSGGLNRFYELRTFKCANGVYINHSDVAGDSGDFHFTSCRFTGPTESPYSGVGMKIVKLGGLVICDTKFQKWDGGLLLEPDVAAATISSWVPIMGTYITGSQFEDNTTYEIKISAAAGVAATKYPYGTKIVGGTTHQNIIIDKADGVIFDAVLMPQYPATLPVVNSGALNVEFRSCESPQNTDLNARITGTGTWSITGRTTTSKDFIRAPQGLSIITTGGFVGITDAYGTGQFGSNKTAITSAPNFVGQYAKVGSLWYKAVGVASSADWKLQTNSFPTSIAGTPEFVGQEALVGGIWYKADGTASPADWKMLASGGGDIDGGAFTDTYINTANIDGGAFV